jgi:hypothetical protein
MKNMFIGVMIIVTVLFSCTKSVDHTNDDEVKCTCNPKPHDGCDGEKFHYIDCEINK